MGTEGEVEVGDEAEAVDGFEVGEEVGCEVVALVPGICWCASGSPVGWGEGGSEADEVCVGCKWVSVIIIIIIDGVIVVVESMGYMLEF